MTRANYTRRPDKRKPERDVQQAAERYRLHRNRFEIPEAHVGEDMLDEVDIHEQFEPHELTAIVKQIVVGKDARLSEVLVGHEFQDESVEHIAKVLGIARNTAQNRLVEAKRIFRLLARKVLGDNRNAMPQQGWRGVAHELRYDEIPAVKWPTCAAADSEEASSLRLRRLRRIMDSGVHLRVGPTAGFIAALYWPPELPTTAKLVSLVIPARCEIVLGAFKRVTASKDHACHFRVS